MSLVRRLLIIHNMHNPINPKVVVMAVELGHVSPDALKALIDFTRSSESTDNASNETPVSTDVTTQDAPVSPETASSDESVPQSAPETAPTESDAQTTE